MLRTLTVGITPSPFSIAISDCDLRGPAGRPLQIDNRQLAIGNSYAFFVALRTITTVPFAPGTAPRIINRLFSASTRATVRPLIVIRASPMWPDERLPLITRDGYAEAPIEPGARTFIEPCDSGPRLKWWRLIVPAKPRPFERPITSTTSPSANWSTSTLSP